MTSDPCFSLEDKGREEKMKTVWPLCNCRGGGMFRNPPAPLLKIPFKNFKQWKVYEREWVCV